MRVETRSRTEIAADAAFRIVDHLGAAQALATSGKLDEAKIQLSEVLDEARRIRDMTSEILADLDFFSRFADGL